MDDVSCTSFSTTKPEEEEKEDYGELPSVAEFIDKSPEEAEQVNTFHPVPNRSFWEATMRIYIHTDISVRTPQILLLLGRRSI